jgi:hypothetical protein
LVLLIYFGIGYPSALFVRYLERATSRGEGRR